MLADQLCFKSSKRTAGLEYVEDGPGRINKKISQTPMGRIVLSIQLGSTVCFWNKIFYIFIIIESKQQTRAIQPRQKAAKRLADMIQVPENIRMIPSTTI
jgi:hypothetical protein